MKPTIEYLRENFDKFNVMYFNGTLKTPAFELFKSKRIFGQCAWETSWWVTSYKIRISTYYDREEKNVLNTLIHEMIHLYIRQNNIKDTRAHHGRVFHSIANRINAEGGWHIDTHSNDRDCGVSDEVKADTYYLAAFYLVKERRYFCIAMNKKYLSAFRRKFELHQRLFSDVFFFRTTDSKFAHYRKCRDRIGGFYITKEEYDTYKSTMDILCEGDELYTIKINDKLTAIAKF